MLIKSFKINHKKLKPGIYLHEVKKLGNQYVTTYDLRFKTPNKGDYLSNITMHSLEHLIATFYSNEFPDDKIYFGPMGCQTGFYLVVSGNKSLKWLEKSLVSLNIYILKAKLIPGNNAMSCGNYKTLNLKNAKKIWKEWYSLKNKWTKQYNK